MTRQAVGEYIEAIRGRYLRARKKEKGRIVDEAMQVTGYHRKALLRLLHRVQRPGGARRGRPRRYGAEAREALRVLWEATDRPCGQRLRPFLPEMVRVLGWHGELSMGEGLKAQVLDASASTIDRLLRPYKDKPRRVGLSTTKPGALLKGAIPMGTFADWEEARPGFLEMDLVAHCGESAEGFYLHTLSAVDVATGWVECQGVWGKGQERVGGAIHRIRQHLPFPLLGLDSDNGSEFINQRLFAYCQRHHITFTRSRPYKKNDSAFVEQKNGSVVRRLVGYDRYSSRAALEALDRLYGLLRWYVNFFQPVMKLKHKSRHGARVHKVYDTARTPYQRLLESGALSPTQATRLAATYRALNPVLLLRQVHSAQEQLWRLAHRAG
jgi:hypothetical protein